MGCGSLRSSLETGEQLTHLICLVVAMVVIEYFLTLLLVLTAHCHPLLTITKTIVLVCRSCFPTDISSLTVVY